MIAIKKSWVYLGPPLVTMSIGFGWTFDSINTVKLFMLSMVAGMAFSSVWAELIRIKFLVDKLIISAAFLFLIALINPLLFSGSPISQQIYGVSGRNLGFLHYLFLIMIFLSAYLIGDLKYSEKFLNALAFSGIAEAIYGLMQYTGNEIISWRNPDKWVMGTFGNPNFLSSFLAMSLSAVIWKIIRSRRLLSRFLYCGSFFLILSAIVASHSSQGIFLTAILISCHAIWALFKISRKGGVFASVLFIIILLLALLGLLQKGPLALYVYQDSVSFRGDYWRSGFRMFSHNWLAGVGLDSYGDFYRLYRDSEAAHRRGLEVTSNSAHNIFIDLGATGGILLVAAYIIITFLVLLTIIRRFGKKGGVGLSQFSLILVWILFNVQTLVSINVSSLAIWGWLSSGLLLSELRDVKFQTQRTLKATRSGWYSRLIQLSLITFLASIIVSPLIVKDVNMATAVNGNNLEMLTEVVQQFPTDCDQLIRVANIHEKLGNHSTSLLLARAALKINKRCVTAWKLVLNNQNTDEQKKLAAERMISLLDPKSLK